MTTPNHFLLAADNAPSLLPLLQSNPSLATSQDEHGYSLLHAAASYNHTSLLRALVQDFHASSNIRDEDGETPLFVAETVETAEFLVKELGVDVEAKNAEGMTAEEKIRGEGEFVAVSDYLRELRRKGGGAMGMSNGEGDCDGAYQEEAERPPPLPPNVTINMGTMDDEEGLGDADPVFRQRIEELAAMGDFQDEGGQQKLREIVRDAVRGVEQDSGRDVRRRVA
ncbi:MAG: hypothetical protein LQ342_002326 [Letrouitia transgressa]|nr:MAG: hypothetical protein LQ342_002326 [Letrouitia transgressa]